MAAPKTPADRAIADVEKAIQSSDKAHEKYDAAAAKADEAMEAAKRADRELRWRSSHPDLPEDFDLDEFRRSLEAPFDEEPIEKEAFSPPPEQEAEGERIGDAIESGAIDPDALEEKVDATSAADSGEIDDPWGED